MAEDEGPQSPKAIGLRRYVYMDVEGPHDDVRNWYGERERSGSEEMERGKSIKAIL